MRIVSSSFLTDIDSTPRVEFIEGQAGRDLYEAARNLPDYLIPKSPYYDLKLTGSRPTGSIIEVPIPNDSMPYDDTQRLRLGEWRMATSAQRCSRGR
ncbi:MAG: hypothetical protein HC802_11045 [Caldilineaceae bacterium]|nr:hypothetical protein [Caldilineaceae bacterium]